MLEPGAEPHEDRAADQRAQHDVQDPLVGLAAAARLDDEDEPGGQHPEHDEEPVRLHGQVDAEEVAQGGVHASGVSGRQAGTIKEPQSPARARVPMAMPITKPAAGLAGTPEAQQQDRQPAAAAMNSDEDQPVRGSALTVSFSVAQLSTDAKTIDHPHERWRPGRATIPMATAQPLTCRGGSGDGSPGGGASPYGLLVTRTGSQNTA